MKSERSVKPMNRAKAYIRIITKDRNAPYRIPNNSRTGSILKKFSIALPYFKAFRIGKYCYIAASPEALEALCRIFEKRLQHHIDRERELIYALDLISKSEGRIVGRNADGEPIKSKTQ